MNGIRIETGDFRVLSEQLSDDSVDLVLTDPPYNRESLYLYDDLGRVGARVLKTGGSLLSYAGHYAIPEVLALVSTHLRFWWLLAVDQSGPAARLPGKWVFVEWKPMVWFVKGGRGGRRYVSDKVKSMPADKKYHKWQQCVSEARYYIEHLTEPGDLVLDPFTGGGTTAIAALQTGRRFIGYEIDPHVADVARQRIANAQMPLFAPALTATQPELAILAAAR